MHKSTDFKDAAEEIKEKLKVVNRDGKEDGRVSLPRIKARNRYSMVGGWEDCLG